MHISSHPKVNVLLSLLIISSGCLALFISAKLGVHAASPLISLSPNHGHPSLSLKVIGTSFGVNEIVSISFDAMPVGTTTTNSTGVFTTKITIPSSAHPGNHTIQATGQSSGFFAQALFLVQTDWTMFGFSVQGSHFNPYENVLDSSNVSNLTLDWKYTTGDTIVSSPAVVNGVVYIGSDDGNIYAFNAATGALLWSYSTGFGSYCRCVNSSPAVAKGIVYVGAGDGKLYALNATTGSLIWTYAAGDAVQTAVTVVNDVVYFGSNDDNLYAVNATTGARLWSFAHGIMINTPPAVANGVAYFGTDDGIMYAFKATTGTLLWSYSTKVAFDSLAVANGVVYAGAYNNGSGLYAFNAKKGTVLWTYPDIYGFTSTVVVNGVIYVGSYDHNIYAFHLPGMTP